MENLSEEEKYEYFSKKYKSSINIINSINEIQKLKKNSNIDLYHSYNYVKKKIRK